MTRIKLTTHGDINQALESDARIYTELMKSRGMTDFQWKKAFKRVVSQMALSWGWDKKGAHRLARFTLGHYMIEWKTRDFAMYRKEWRIYSPETAALEFMGIV